jgi:hypothetical protein
MVELSTPAVPMRGQRTAGAWEAFPSPHTARPVPRGRPVSGHCHHRWGFPCCLSIPLAHMPSPVSPTLRMLVLYRVEYRISIRFVVLDHERLNVIDSRAVATTYRFALLRSIGFLLKSCASFCSSFATCAATRLSRRRSVFVIKSLSGFSGDFGFDACFCNSGSLPKKNASRIE